MRGNAQSVFLQLGGDRLAVVKAQDPTRWGGKLGGVARSLRFGGFLALAKLLVNYTP